MKLDEFRAALREPPPQPLAVSLDAVLAAGRRRRARRRVGVTLTAAGATAAVVAGVPAVLADRPAGRTQAPAAGAPGPGTTATTPTTSPTPRPTSARVSPRSTGERSDARRLGAAIRTGERVLGGERVFWFESVAGRADRSAYLELCEGVQQRADSVRPLGCMNDDGPPLAPGFHAVWINEGGTVRDWLVMGYYVGPAAKIITRVGRQTVLARTGTWSQNRKVQVFWFGNGTGAPDPGVRRTDGKLDRRAGLGPLGAYDAAGRTLPTLNNKPTVG